MLTCSGLVDGGPDVFKDPSDDFQPCSLQQEIGYFLDRKPDRR